LETTFSFRAGIYESNGQGTGKPNGLLVGGCELSLGEKLAALKMLNNGAESPTPGARFVRRIYINLRQSGETTVP
jgi:hypothetical protein